LPHIIPEATFTPPCTARYILPQGINVKNVAITDRVGYEVCIQLHQHNSTLVKEAEATFSQMQGSKNDKEASIDITASTPLELC